MYYTDPEPYVFLIREGEAYHVRKDHPEPQKLDLRKAPLMSGMARMFRLDPAQLQKAFEVSADPSEDGAELAVQLVRQARGQPLNNKYGEKGP